MMHDPDIKLTAPAVFAEAPVSTASRHYTFIPTTTLINDFRKLGWEVVRATQQNSHIDPVHTKHRVTFRSADYPSVNGVFPELIMVNSHDRTASFTFMLGLFRLVCSNGLVASVKQFENFRIRHIGYEFDAIKELTQTIMESMPSVMSTIMRMQTVTLTQKQEVIFAYQAIAARFPEYRLDKKRVDFKAINEAIDIPAFLYPVREEDNSQTVWAVYNKIQEKLLKGGWQRIGTKDERSKRVRPVTNIKLDIDLNKNLWQLANSYAKINA